MSGKHVWKTVLIFLLNFYMQLHQENKLCKSSVMVTAGANQVRAGGFGCF